MPPLLRVFGLAPTANAFRPCSERSLFPTVTILEGSFEAIPLESASLDYLYSTLSFHWCTDLDKAVAELKRVPKPGGEMDLMFIGRDNGREFIQVTTPLFLSYMGPKLLLESARLRKQLERNAAEDLFRQAFPDRILEVSERYETHYDSLEGHWGWGGCGSRVTSFRSRRRSSWSATRR